MSVLGNAIAGIAGNAIDAYSQGVARGDAKVQAKEDRAWALEQRDVARAEAKRRQQEGEFRLNVMQRTDNTAEANYEQNLAILQQQLDSQERDIRRSKNKQTKTDILNMLDLVFESGEPDAFNRLLQESPEFSEALRGTVRIDKLDLNTPADRAEVLRLGITEEQLDEYDGQADGQIDWVKLQSRFFKATDSEGNVETRDILTTAVAMGYGDFADNKRMTNLERLADLQKDRKAGTPSSLSQGKTALLLEAEAAGEAEERVARGEGTAADRHLLNKYSNNVGGVRAGNQRLGQEASVKWEEAGLDNLSQAELQANPVARKLVQEMELYSPLSQAHEKSLQDLGTMVSLMSDAQNLSEESTGLFDAQVSSMMSYITDDTTNKVDKASYMGLVNTFRHNLFGSALTEGELKAFSKAYGTDGQQLGPILAGLRSMATQINSQLTTISNLNNDKVIQFRAGAMVDDMVKAKAGIEIRLEFLNLIEDGYTPEEAQELVNKTGSGSDYMDRVVTPNPRANQPERKASNYSTDDITKRLGL